MAQADNQQILMNMYKEANQLLTQKVKTLSIENATLKKELETFKSSVNITPSQSVQSPCKNGVTVSSTSCDASTDPVVSGEQVSGLNEDILSEVENLRRELSLSAKKIHFLSHYGVCVKRDFDNLKGKQKRRMSEISSQESRVLKLVSEESKRRISSSEEDLSHVHFAEAVQKIQDSAALMLQKYRDEIAELRNSRS